MSSYFGVWMRWVSICLHKITSACWVGSSSSSIVQFEAFSGVWGYPRQPLRAWQQQHRTYIWPRLQQPNRIPGGISEGLNTHVNPVPAWLSRGLRSRSATNAQLLICLPGRGGLPSKAETGFSVPFSKRSPSRKWQACTWPGNLKSEVFCGVLV